MKTAGFALLFTCLAACVPQTPQQQANTLNALGIAAGYAQQRDALRRQSVGNQVLCQPFMDGILCSPW